MIGFEPILLKGTRYLDDRGYLRSLYKKSELPELDFVEDRVSYSNFLVLRGLHGDKNTWKLVTCLYGIIEFVVVDARKESEKYGQHYIYTLAPSECKSILVPPRFLNGHLVTSREAILHYKWTEYYSGPENQVTVKWDDPELNVKWPYGIGFNFLPILSERDKKGVPFREVNL